MALPSLSYTLNCSVYAHLIVLLNMMKVQIKLFSLISLLTELNRFVEFMKRSFIVKLRKTKLIKGFS